MSISPRIIVPGVPHHVTQRGNRRQRVFWVDDDYGLYIKTGWLSLTAKRRKGVVVLSDGHR
jgi:putative transposase